MKPLTELRRAVDTALASMETVNADIRDAAAGADFDDLETQFKAAQRDHTVAQAAFRDGAAFDAAKRSLPVAIMLDDQDDEHERAPAGPWNMRGKPGARVTREPLTYERHSPHSVFRDMRSSKHGDGAAQERLQRHAQEMRVEQRAISTTDGGSGEFVPPLWLQDQWVPLQRAGRPIANTLNLLPLPPSTDQINLPKVTGGTAVAIQTDGGAVTSQDVTSTSVTGAVQTIAGQQDASQQLLDLSLPGIDRVIFDDLSRAYATQLDQKVINGAVTNAKGLLQVAGTNSVTYTDTTPTVPEMYSKVADCYQKVNSLRFLPPEFIAMTPMRWAWILASLDSQNRPLVVPVGQPGFNAAGRSDKVAAEDTVGNFFGLPVVVDANIPATFGAGTNEDRILVYRGSDIYLWESEPRLRLFEDVLSGSLSVRFQIYGYFAQIAGRLPAGISILSGTALTPVAF